MDQLLIKRLALGRPGYLGDLYDARTECFCGGSIIGQSKIPSEMKQCMDSPKYDCHIMKENTYKELLKDFGYDGQLKASFLAGMLSLQGSGAYLKDLKASSRSVKATLRFEVGTKYESINVSHKSFERYVSPNVLRDDLHMQATHFVMGIQWGANAYASVESESGLDSDARCIKGKLSAGVKELGTLLLAGVGVGLQAKTGAGKRCTAIEGEENFKFRVHADVLPDSAEDMLLPKNFHEALTLMSKIPQLIHNSNQGKGRPLEFTLYPLSEIRKLSTSHNQLLRTIAGRNQPTQSCTFTTLGIPTIETLESLFDELQLSKQNLNDLYKDVSIHHSAAFSSQKIEEILNFKNNMETAEAHLKAVIRDHIIAIRSHKGEVADLMETMSNFSAQSPFSPSKAKMFIKHYVEKLNWITNLEKQGVHFILQASSSESASNSTASTLESCCMPPHNVTSWVVILTYCEPSSKQNGLEWRRNWQIFWHLHSQSKCGEDKEAGDVDSESAPRFYVQENHDVICKCSMRVSVYRNGDVVSEDTSRMMGGSQQNKPQQNLVYSKLKHEVNVQAPNARIPLQTYCPGHHVQSDLMPSCPKDILQDWACERCKGHVENGKDGFFYCLCGRVPVRACRFRCCSQNHGPLFITFPAQYMGIILEQQEVPQQINILLLGETGVGKSTFINAFANYISYDSLESAASSAEELVGLIHMAFTHTDQMTFESHDIRFGPSDPNEIHHEGQSATQSCRSYSINLNQNQIVEFIDTPGVGDTRGVEQDHTNFQHMLDYLNNYTEIHGICVMLRPNTTRLTITFRFCIKELLRHLHKSASENIVFLFTNARSTFYTPGDTVTPLKKLLQEIKESPSQVDFAFNKRTVYCMDNEAFRFLLASKEGCSFSPEDTESYAKSWSKSADQCKQLLEHFRSLKPHNVRETVSLNNASSLVSKLQQPLADVSVTIQKNIAKWDGYKKELEEFKGSIVDLEKKLLDDEVLNLQAVHFKKGACTVCYSCCEKQETDNGEIVNNKQVCHERCSSSKVTRAVMKGKAVWFCRSIDWQGLCKVCGCEYKKHARITYDAKVVPEKVVNKDIEKKLQNKCKKKEAQELKISELEQRCKEWQEELDEITQACARFALFFKNNAITPHNDDMKAYVHHHIAAEKNRTNYNTELIAKWEAFLESYQKQMDDLDRMCTHVGGDTGTGSSSDVTDSYKNPFTYADILKLAKSLFQLKHNGKTIKNLVDEVNNCEHRTQFHNKIHHCKKFADKIKVCATGSSQQQPAFLFSTGACHQQPTKSSRRTRHRIAKRPIRIAAQSKPFSLDHWDIQPSKTTSQMCPDQ